MSNLNIKGNSKYLAIYKCVRRGEAVETEENDCNGLNTLCIIIIPLGCQGQNKLRYSPLISESQGAEYSHFLRTITQPHRTRINLQDLMLIWHRNAFVLCGLRMKGHVTIIGLNWNYLISSLVGSNWSPRNVRQFSLNLS